MAKTPVRLTLIDGPTLLIEIGGLRLLTDPTFDEPQVHLLGTEVLKKQNTPPVRPESLLPIHAVLLSYDEHYDNLDHAGRELLPKADVVISTPGAAGRLAGNTIGLEPWVSTSLSMSDGRKLTITGTPARHGPVGIEPIAGVVTGFVLSIHGSRHIYISGDTVWYSGIAEVAERFDVGLAILFTGSAQPRGPFNVTMSANDAIEAAAAFEDAQIAAIHNVGWSHYVQSQEDLARAFETVGIGGRLLSLTPMASVTIHL